MIPDFIKNTEHYKALSEDDFYPYYKDLETLDKSVDLYEMYKIYDKLMVQAKDVEERFFILLYKTKDYSFISKIRQDIYGLTLMPYIIELMKYPFEFALRMNFMHLMINLDQNFCERRVENNYNEYFYFLNLRQIKQIKRYLPKNKSVVNFCLEADNDVCFDYLLDNGYDYQEVNAQVKEKCFDVLIKRNLINVNTFDIYNFRYVLSKIIKKTIRTFTDKEIYFIFNNSKYDNVFCLNYLLKIGFNMTLNDYDYIDNLEVIKFYLKNRISMNNLSNLISITDYDKEVIELLIETKLLNNKMIKEILEELNEDNINLLIDKGYIV